MKKQTYERLICNNQQCKHKLRGEIQPESTSAGKDPKGGWGGYGRFQTKQKTTVSYCCEKKRNNLHMIMYRLGCSLQDVFSEPSPPFGLCS